MKFTAFLESLRKLMEACPTEALDPAGRYVVLSDLHLGDGGTKDDLEPNRALLETALEKWYLENGYTLILNGDIEDLNKFSLRQIRRAWPRFFAILAAFAQAGRLRKIIGNHDLGLLVEKDYPYPVHHGLKLRHGNRNLFIFHGHQASKFFIKYDYLSEFLVRYLAKPLRIRNTGISGDSKRRFAAERRIYRAARELGIIAVTGHTHRPLFESLSKYDSLRWSLEELLREYAVSGADQRRRIAELVDIYRQELERIPKKELRWDHSRSLYSASPLLIPCLFNSGCATGKHGVTALELDRCAMSLVHWASEGTSRPYIQKEALYKDSLDGGYSRYTLKSDHLDQVFARIELLGGRVMPFETEVPEEDDLPMAY